jgi:hypothetical protein
MSVFYQKHLIRSFSRKIAQVEQEKRTTYPASQTRFGGLNARSGGFHARYRFHPRLHGVAARCVSSLKPVPSMDRPQTRLLSWTIRPHPRGTRHGVNASFKQDTAVGTIASALGFSGVFWQGQQCG